MKLTRASGTLGLVAIVVIASPFAAADDSGWYIGANVGQSRAKIDDERITSSLLGRGFSGISIADDDRDTGYKLFGGYKFNKNVAVEGGYFDLGKFGYAATMDPSGTLNGNIKLKGLNLDLVGMLPITERFSVFGRDKYPLGTARSGPSTRGARGMSRRPARTGRSRPRSHCSRNRTGIS